MPMNYMADFLITAATITIAWVVTWLAVKETSDE